MSKHPLKDKGFMKRQAHPLQAVCDELNEFKHVIGHQCPADLQKLIDEHDVVLSEYTAWCDRQIKEYYDYPLCRPYD